MTQSLLELLAEVRACTVCSASLPLGPRPVVQIGACARILVIGQAPSSRVHETGAPWNDLSGARLREWMGVDAATFYDHERIATMAMGFCYPGVARSGGDNPPRRECAPLWHERLRAHLTGVRLTLLVGSYAQNAYLKQPSRQLLTKAVRNYALFLPDFLPLPHPSWRSTGWMRRNPWFEAEVLPALRERVAAALAEGDTARLSRRRHQKSVRVSDRASSPTPPSSP
jgi:uracil-DNA glycosylase